MVTVIADKEELTTPVNNGVTVGSNGNERSFQYIKDYQEVNLEIFLSIEKIHLFNLRLIFIDQFRVNLYLKIYSD